MKINSLIINLIVIATLATCARAQTITGALNPSGNFKLTPGKVYDVGSSRVNLPAGCTLDTTGATITGHPADGVLIGAAGNNVAVIGAGTVNGGDIYIDGGRSGLLVDGPTIQNTRNDVGLQQQGAIGAVNASGITVRNVTIRNCPFIATISDCSDVKFDGFKSDHVGYGLKIWGDNPANHNWTVRNFWVHDCPANFMALEIQGAPTGVLIENGIVERIAFGPNNSDNVHSLLVSTPCAKGQKITVRNVAITGQRPLDDDTNRWSNGAPVLIEAGGDGFLIENCLLDGGGWAVSVTDTDGTCSGIIRNNLVRNCWETINTSSSSQKVNVNLPQPNNGANVILPWTMDQLRAIVGVAGANLPAAPVTQPTTRPATLPTNPTTVPATQPTTLPATNPTSGPATRPQIDPIIEVDVIHQSGKRDISRP